MHRIILAGLLAAVPFAAMAQDSAKPMKHDQMAGGAAAMMTASSDASVSEPGQGAFAAIAEIVAILKDDPDTDWSRVNIDALREHLRDMNVVTIDAGVVAEDVEGGVRFTVTGPENVVPSIRRMSLGHANFMDGVDGWSYSAKEVANGATMTIRVPAADMAELKGLGFFGVLASGMHHQPHHWMMATGDITGMN